jgi:hypothetical protein
MQCNLLAINPAVKSRTTMVTASLCKLMLISTTLWIVKKFFYFFMLMIQNKSECFDMKIFFSSRLYMCQFFMIQIWGMNQFIRFRLTNKITIVWRHIKTNARLNLIQSNMMKNTSHILYFKAHYVLKMLILGYFPSSLVNSFIFFFCCFVWKSV